MARAGWLAGIASLLLVAACSSSPSKPAAAAHTLPAAKAQPTLAELLQQAETAAKEGARERARLAYREAASAYPTAKAPWSRLAADYFETEDYGNAILAAQEVVQRDSQDPAAHGILAVAGLRVSAAALKTLREQQTEVPSNTKSEAARLTQTLRDVLGEPVLVPQAAPAPAAQANQAPRAAVRPVGRAAPRPAAPASAPAAVPAPKPAGNPLDRFK